MGEHEGFRSGRKKCVILGCENWSDEGLFVGDLCAPCYGWVVHGSGRYSQAWRNALRSVGEGSRQVVRECLQKIFSDQFG